MFMPIPTAGVSYRSSISFGCNDHSGRLMATGPKALYRIGQKGPQPTRNAILGPHVILETTNEDA